jgi:hypothetical protein
MGDVIRARLCMVPRACAVGLYVVLVGSTRLAGARDSKSSKNVWCKEWKTCVSLPDCRPRHVSAVKSKDVMLLVRYIHTKYREGLAHGLDC